MRKRCQCEQTHKLSNEWKKIIVIGRRAPSVENPKVHALIVEDIKNPQVTIDSNQLKDADHYFNCIGTTRAKAGGGKGFYDIEVGLTVELVALVLKTHLILVVGILLVLHEVWNSTSTV